MRIGFCDDEVSCREEIRNLLAGWPEQPENLQVEAFEDGDALISAHSAKPFDMIILDVIMPLLNGIETAEEIRRQDQSTKLVFLTSSRDFAVESYAVKADDYLLKPVQASKFYACLNELSEEIRERDKAILVKGARVFHRIEIKKIEYIEAQNKHIVFSLSDGRQIESVEPLYTYEKQLLITDGFFKCSRSYIVNLYQIDTFSAKEIKTHSGYRIPIARKCQKEFEAAYFEAFFGKEGDF